uniref:Uncharacterized protein n=1 Tax=Anguilla anguilla TaxID=7936 RepID=A0A0E9QMC5_ANGAN
MRGVYFIRSCYHISYNTELSHNYKCVCSGFFCCYTLNQSMHIKDCVETMELWWNQLLTL